MNENKDHPPQSGKALTAGLRGYTPDGRGIRHKEIKRKIIIIMMIVLLSVVVICFAFPIAFWSIGSMLYPSSGGAHSSGFMRPLIEIDPTDDSEYLVAYDYKGFWHVVDDSDFIKDHYREFITYKKEKGGGDSLILFKDGELIFSMQLETCPYGAVNEGSFKKTAKKMTRQEFRVYYKMHELSGSVFD